MLTCLWEAITGGGFIGIVGLLLLCTAIILVALTRKPKLATYCTILGWQFILWGILRSIILSFNCMHNRPCALEHNVLMYDVIAGCFIPALILTLILFVLLNSFRKGFIDFKPYKWLWTSIGIVVLDILVASYLISRVSLGW